MLNPIRVKGFALSQLNPAKPDNPANPPNPTWDKGIRLA
jgi:hypothetical protein